MSAKINQPSPQIFTSDPLEQIYAKSVMDPVYGGLAGMMASIQSNRRRMNQDDYLEGLQQSNTIAGQVAMQEAAQKQQQELVKAAIDLMKLGQPGESMPILQSIIKQGLNSGSDLHRKLIESEIIKNQRDPSAGSNGLKFKGEVTNLGTPTMSVTGGSEAEVNAATDRMIAKMLRGKGPPTGTPTSSPNKAAETVQRKHPGLQ